MRKRAVNVVGNLLETKADPREVGHINEENEWAKRLGELRDGTDAPSGGTKIKARKPVPGQRKRTSPAQRLAVRRG